MAASFLSISVAEEFLICDHCHHPIDIQQCSPIAPVAKTRPSSCPQYASRPRYATSTPQPRRAQDSPRELLRKGGQPRAERVPSGGGPELIGADEASLLSDRTERSSRDAADSYLRQAADFDLSDDFVPEGSCVLPKHSNPALCVTCSMSHRRRHELDLLADRTTTGSRMSMYFPDRTGFDLDYNQTDAVCCDGMSSYSMNSEDSGACDVDVGLHLSHECSLDTEESGREENIRTEEANQQLRPSIKYSYTQIRLNNNNNNNSGSKHNNNNDSSNNKSSKNNNNNNNNNSSYDIIRTPRQWQSGNREKNTNPDISLPRQKPQQSQSVLDDLLAQFTEQKNTIIKLSEAVGETFSGARQHLERARKYYHELVEQWFWKNVIVLEKERELANDERERNAETLRAATICVARHAKDVQQAGKRTHRTRDNQDLEGNLKKLADCIQELKQLSSGLTEVVFVAGHCEHLMKEDLGKVIIHRRVGAERLLRTVLPSKCLWSFDSRNGRTSEYMATGLSLTSGGDVIVADTGLDAVTVFSKRGAKRLDVNTAPEDHPTTATEFGDFIAVACSSEVKLYDKVSGIYHRTQLARSLSHPQGVTTDKHGHLVIAGYCIDIPVIAVHDRDTHLLNEIVSGEYRCEPASEDAIGSDPDDLNSTVLFSKPWYIGIDQSNQFLVCDRDSHSINVINRQRELVEEIGSLGHKPAEFFHPAGLCTDPGGRIIVADSQNNRIQVLTPNQNTALCLLDREHDGIECPMDVALDNSGLLFVLQGNGLVRVFQYC